jgi:hypothetical protein
VCTRDTPITEAGAIQSWWEGGQQARQVTRTREMSKMGCFFQRPER